MAMADKADKADKKIRSYEYSDLLNIIIIHG
jgi:hypothetical protein